MNYSRTKLLNGTALQIVGKTLLTFTLVVLSPQISAIPVSAQELTAEEQIPLGAELVPEERVMSEQGLRFAAEVAIKRWKSLEADEATRSFDAYFEVFREVARIESFEHATKIAGVDIRSPLVSVASDLIGKMSDEGLSARGAGVRALESLVSKLQNSTEIEDADSLKVRYTLILDYMSGIDVTRLAVDLAEGLSRAKRPDMALDIYADFLTSYFDDLPSRQERLELVTLASAQASKMADPAVFRVLTDVLRMAPRAEKFDLAQVAFGEVDVEVLRDLVGQDSNDDSLILDAWLNAVEFTKGLKTEADLVEIRERARISLETPAFEILALSVSDAAQRNVIVSKAVLADVAQGRALVGFDRALNLAMTPESAPDAYLALLESFAADGYTNYVRALTTGMAGAVKAGKLTLDPEQSDALLRYVEASNDPEFVRSLLPALPQLSEGLERSALRAGIRAAFASSVEKPIGSEPIHIGTGVNQGLRTAASLTNGELPTAASLSALSPSNDEDMALLSVVAAKLWQYPHRRPLLVDFMASDARVELKQAIALGVTDFMGFEVGEINGAAFATQVHAILGSVSEEARDLLSASIGQVEAADRLSGDALIRYSRYLAATGKNFSGVEHESAEQAGLVNAAAAAFTTVDLATDQLKAIGDYKERVRAFRRLAEARASVLDDKGWLNSATNPVPATDPTLAVGTAGISDGRISAAAVDKNAVPASGRPFMPNLLVGRDAVASRIPVPTARDSNEALADISKRGETRATRLIRFSSEHFDDIINLGVREYLYLNSETTVPRIIFVTRGVMTMSELIAQVRATAPDAITIDGGTVTFNVPLAINDGASLIVSGQEIKALRLNTKAGAFLVNSGKIYFDNVVVSSFDEATGGPSYIHDHEKGIFFRPFVLGWSGSETYAVDSHFLALGYAGGRTYGMSLSSGSTDTAARQVQASAPTGYFIDNSFDNLYYGFYAFEAEDIVFVGNELVDGVIYGLDPHDRSRNLMMAYNTAYGTQKKHGIIISREVDDSFILGNLSFENHGTGIMLDRESYGTVVYANDASRNDGDGFAAMESPCALVENNMFYANGRSGIKIRNSWDVHVESNQILHNKSAGIEAYIDNLELAQQSEFRNFKEDPYSPIATVAARDNVLRKNGVGLLTRGASEARFVGNRFIDQLPRYVGGDLKPLGLDVVAENMQSGVVVRSVCMPRIPVHKVCSLSRDGVIGAQSVQPEFISASAASDLCVGTTGSPQAAAFNPPEGE